MSERTVGGVRVACRNAAASNLINGVRFGALLVAEGETPVMVSEPVADDVAGGFCRNPDFTIESFDDGQLESVDAAIEASATEAVVDTAAGAASAEQARLAEELTRANQAQAAELDRLQVENAELSLRLSRSHAAEVDRLNAQVAEMHARPVPPDVLERVRGEVRAELTAAHAAEVERLTGDLTTAGAERKRLEDEVALLRTTNEQLGKALEEAGPAPKRGGKGGK